MITLWPDNSRNGRYRSVQDNRCLRQYTNQSFQCFCCASEFWCAHLRTDDRHKGPLRAFQLLYRLGLEEELRLTFTSRDRRASLRADLGVLGRHLLERVTECSRAAIATRKIHICRGKRKPVCVQSLGRYRGCDAGTVGGCTPCCGSLPHRRGGSKRRKGCLGVVQSTRCHAIALLSLRGRWLVPKRREWVRRALELVSLLQ